MPMDHRRWTADFDYSHPDEAVFTFLDRYLDACRSRDIHLCLNLHRAPGYCITDAEIERHNLWTDVEAQDGFVAIWEALATRFRGTDPDSLSFDLVNEPPALGLTHSTRAHAPYPVTHWGAEWFDGWKLGDAPRWPGVDFEGRRWTKDDLRASTTRAGRSSGRAPRCTWVSSAATSTPRTTMRSAGSPTSSPC